jgi:hypothetical protein
VSSGSLEKEKKLKKKIGIFLILVMRASHIFTSEGRVEVAPSLLFHPEEVTPLIRDLEPLPYNHLSAGTASCRDDASEGCLNLFSLMRKWWCCEKKIDLVQEQEDQEEIDAFLEGLRLTLQIENENRNPVTCVHCRKRNLR